MQEDAFLGFGDQLVCSLFDTCFCRYGCSGFKGLRRETFLDLLAKRGNHAKRKFKHDFAAVSHRLLARPLLIIATVESVAVLVSNVCVLYV